MGKIKQTEFIAGTKGATSVFENKKLLEKAEKELSSFYKSSQKTKDTETDSKKGSNKFLGNMLEEQDW